MVDCNQICAEILKLAQPDLSVRVELYGVIEFYLNLDDIYSRCQDKFAGISVKDHSQLLQSNYLNNMAQENTVRGIMARLLQELAEKATEKRQLRIYELALRELLARFANLSGDCL
jgi:hypothetical protein